MADWGAASSRPEDPVTNKQRCADLLQAILKKLKEPEEKYKKYQKERKERQTAHGKYMRDLEAQQKSTKEAVAAKFEQWERKAREELQRKLKHYRQPPITQAKSRQQKRRPMQQWKPQSTCRPLG